MIEILDDMGSLTRPDLDLKAAEMGGVALGAPVAAIPRHSILYVELPSVARYRNGIGLDGEYVDADGRRLPLRAVLDGAAQADGFVYCADQFSYKVQAGHVVGFAIFGPHLSHFAHLTTYEQMLAAFGKPDRMREAGAYGDLVTYSNYYWRTQKLVRWNALERRIDLINLGAFEGNSGP